MTIESDQPFLEAWHLRRGLTTDQLTHWGAESWFTWFADGLDVWFSDQHSRADREFAFAPLGISIGREQMEDALCRYLDRVCRYAQGAADTLTLRGAIQDGGVKCFRDAVVIYSPQRAAFLLDVFSRWKARCLPKMARLSVQRMLDIVEPLSWPDGETYLSTLCYILFDNDVVGEKDKLSGSIERLIMQSRNFRPALFYSLRLPDGDIETALATFYRLTRPSANAIDEKVWRVVAEEFDRVHGHEFVATTLKHILETRSARWLDTSDALIPASRIEPFYARFKLHEGVSTLFFGGPDDERETEIMAQLHDRGIYDDDDDDIAITEPEVAIHGY